MATGREREYSVSSGEEDSFSFISEETMDIVDPLKPKDSEELFQVETEVRNLVKKIKDYCDDPVKVCGAIGTIRAIFFDKANYRKEIGDLLYDCGYAEYSCKMLTALAKRDFFPTGLGVLTKSNLWRTTRHVLDNLWNYTNYSEVYSHGLTKHGVLTIICRYLSQNSPESILKSRQKEHIAMVGISIMRNIATYKATIQEFWKIDVFRQVERYSRMEKSIIKLITSTTMALVANYQQAQTMTSSTDTVSYIVRLMSLAVGKDDLHRIKERYTASQLALYINKMTVDGNIEALVRTPLVDVYRRMLLSDILQERRQASESLWNLSMDPRHGLKAIIDNEELVRVLKDCVKLKADDEDKQVLRNVQGILEQVFPKKQPTPPTSTKTRHIFINYNKENKATVKRIVDRIKEEGFKIWIDYEKHGHDLLTAIQEAVCSSSVVVVCISEPLRQDPGCKRVANLAHKHQKHFLPLCLQSSYEPEGWLETIAIDRQYIDFSGDDMDFDKSMQEFISVLKHEYNLSSGEVEAAINRNDPQEGDLDVPAEIPFHSRPAPDHLEKMTTQKCSRWLITNNLPNYVQKMEKMDGKKLWELACMKFYNYDLFCEELQITYGISPQDLPHFCAILENLIKEEDF